MKSIIEHIQKVYGLELVPCSIPKNQFQYFKRNIYLFINHKISQKLFFFLRDKVSPIKYLDERPGGEIWFRKRNSEGVTSIEVEIKRIPAENCIYISNRHESGLFNIIGEDYMVEIYPQSKFYKSDDENISFLLNQINGIEQVDYYFQKNDELKSELRNYKLNNIL